jgi:hypothetical protein
MWNKRKSGCRLGIASFKFPKSLKAFCRINMPQEALPLIINY